MAMKIYIIHDPVTGVIRETCKVEESIATDAFKSRSNLVVIDEGISLHDKMIDVATGKVITAPLPSPTSEQVFEKSWPVDKIIEAFKTGKDLDQLEADAKAVV